MQQESTFDRELREGLADPEFAAAFEEMQEILGNHTPEGDFIEQDRCDDRNYCPHGNFVGNPYGGDYMCHYCEMGIEPEGA